MADTFTEDPATSAHTIYLAGGCFWGVEELFRQIPGVIDTQTGYANGNLSDGVSYERVCQGDTDFRETVRVDFEPMTVTIEQLLWAYFHIIDPTVAQRQGNDVGDQYQTGIYWRPQDAELGAVLMRLAEQERERVQASGRRFLVEVKELSNFFAAEDYHQRYLVKNPNGYCHIPFAQMAEVLQQLG
jgi:peptide methionine sulfoxide reductase msrA/msrB